jgi:C-terminal processing protease CtpA/Prc
MRIATAAVWVCVLGIAAQNVVAQKPADTPVTAADRRQIVEAAARALESDYVVPDKGKEMAAKLRKTLSSKALDGVDSALQLVPMINRIFASLADPHLRFGYQAEAQPVTLDPWAPETPEQREASAREAALNGYGIRGVERLGGNLGLLTITEWDDPSCSGEAVAAAMRLLSTTDALIIDLRKSRGGSPDAVIELVSYFFTGEPFEAGAIYERHTDSIRQFWTHRFVGAPRYLDKAVYVLTSGETWSAAEGFAGQMQKWRGAIVIGEPTHGGRARLGVWRVIHPHFGIFVPSAKAVDPATGHDVPSRVEPDSSCPAADALRSAQLLALRRLRQQATDPDRQASLDELIATLDHAPAL